MHSKLDKKSHHYTITSVSGQKPPAKTSGHKPPNRKPPVKKPSRSNDQLDRIPHSAISNPPKKISPKPISPQTNLPLKPIFPPNKEF